MLLVALLESDRAQIAERGMPAAAVVERPRDTRRLRRARRGAWAVRRWISSVFRVAKKLSATALSQQLAAGSCSRRWRGRASTGGYSRARVLGSRDRSDARGRRGHEVREAMRGAPRETNSVRGSRAHRPADDAARKQIEDHGRDTPNPRAVPMYVISAAQIAVRCDGLETRLTTFAAIAAAQGANRSFRWNSRGVRSPMPLARISRSTRFLPTPRPFGEARAASAGLPYAYRSLRWAAPISHRQLGVARAAEPLGARSFGVKSQPRRHLGLAETVVPGYLGLLVHQ